MTVKKFVVYTICKVCAIITISVIVAVFVRSPVLTNEIALGQMQNSNEIYILTDTLQWLRTSVDILARTASILIAFTIGLDIRKLIECNKKENT